MTDRVYIWFADNGNIRKWSREPFEEATTYLASLPADVDGLMLKSLEWKQTDDAIGEEAFVASTPVGEYLATEAGLYFHVSDATSGDLLLATNGTSEAKTAAFADYSRRILPAIDTSALSAKLAAVARERDTLTERLAEMEAGR